MQFYHHFTLEERESLRIYSGDGKSLREIGRLLKKSPSSISRELKRNRNKDGSYHPWRATTLYIIRRKKSVRPFRLSVDTAMKAWVLECMARYWSPEIIAERWKREEPGRKLSHSTIYAALRGGQLPQCTPKTHLRRHGKRKCSHQCHTIHPDHLIRDWPDEIRNRERLWDWEGDTVYGSIGKGLVITLVDRKSRYFAAALLSKRAVGETKDAVIKALKGLAVNSLSLDNGSEFAGFRELGKELNAPIYFADPHSPWQRASNENMNGLVRFFFPKGTNFHNVTQDELNSVITLINNRPRKCLGWLSPVEFLKCCT